MTQDKNRIAEILDAPGGITVGDAAALIRRELIGPSLPTFDNDHAEDRAALITEVRRFFYAQFEAFDRTPSHRLSRRQELECNIQSVLFAFSRTALPNETFPHSIADRIPEHFPFSQLILPHQTQNAVRVMGTEFVFNALRDDHSLWDSGKQLHWTADISSKNVFADVKALVKECLSAKPSHPIHGDSTRYYINHDDHPISSVTYAIAQIGTRDHREAAAQAIAEAMYEHNPSLGDKVRYAGPNETFPHSIADRIPEHFPFSQLILPHQTQNAVRVMGTEFVFNALRDDHSLWDSGKQLHWTADISSKNVFADVKALVKECLSAKPSHPIHGDSTRYYINHDDHPISSVTYAIAQIGTRDHREAAAQAIAEAMYEHNPSLGDKVRYAGFYGSTEKRQIAAISQGLTDDVEDRINGFGELARNASVELANSANRPVHGLYEIKSPTNDRA